MNKLERSEFVPFAPEETGRIRVNHDTPMCSGSSKSMTIRRHDDGHISAKCFRCSSWGSYYPPEHKYFEAEKRITGAGVCSGDDEYDSGRVILPRDSEADVTRWGVREREIVTRYGIDNSEVVSYGVTYSPKYNRVIFPVYHGSDLVGWQARSYHEDPKYITKCHDGSAMWVYFKCRGGDSDVCTVVEDFWSGIKTARHTNAFVMLGAEMSDAGINKVVDNNKSVVIFNDFDTDKVIQNAFKLKELLTLMGVSSKIVDVGKDPKECSDSELIGLLT